MNRMHYMFAPRRTNVHHLYSFWVVTNLKDANGRKLLREALDYIVSDELPDNLITQPGGRETKSLTVI